MTSCGWTLRSGVRLLQVRLTAPNSIGECSNASVRLFSTGSRAVLEGRQQGQGFSATHKKSSGFGHKSEKKKPPRTLTVGDGGMVKLDEVAARTLANTHGPSNLPELTSLEVGPLLRNSAVAFSSGKRSIVHVYGVPRSAQKDIAHLSQPFSIIRGVTIRSYGWMNKASKYPSRDSRIVLAGTRGSGKTITLMQIADYCAAEGWVVLYVPKTMNWVNSSAPYQYDTRTRTFVQPTIAHGTLKSFSTFNHQILTQLKLPADVALDRTIVPAGATLAALAERGVLEPSEAPEVFKLLLEQLQEQREYPVLLAIDDFQALYHQSTYRDPSFNYIQAYHLSMPRLMLEYASGLKSFRRGAVVGAVSMSNYAFQLPMELRDVLGLVPFRSSNIWAKRNPDYINYAQGLRREWVPPRMNVLEAAAMTEVWEHNEALHSKLTESLFMAKMAEASGNPREFLQHGLLKTAVTW